MNQPLFRKILIVIAVAGLFYPLDVQAQRSASDKTSSNYRNLVRKNLQLRQELKTLEKRYVDLENERKVLILHVKDLQTTKNLTTKMVQDLENTIGSLREEMLKDPKMVKTINQLNQKFREAEQERSRLQKKASLLESEKKRLTGDLNKLRETYTREKADYVRKRVKDVDVGKQSKERNRGLKKELEVARVEFRKSEEKLKRDLKEVYGEKAGWEEKNRDLEGELKETQALLKETKILLAKERKVKRIQTRDNPESMQTHRAFVKKEKKLKAQIKEMGKKQARLQVDLERTKKEKRKIDQKFLKLDGHIQEIEAENRRLVRNREEKHSRLRKTETALAVQVKEAESEKKYFEKQVKNAIADKLLFKIKAENLEERVLKAEEKLSKLQGELEEKTAKSALQESKVTVLKEEKSKLEQKLIRYIEKIIEGEKVIRGTVKKEKRMVKASPQRVPQKRKAAARKSKGKIDQQKLDIHYNLAVAYNRRGMHREEEREYRKCLKINPKDANVHYNLGILYDDKLNKNKKAITHYKKYIQLRPIGEDVDRVKNWILHAEQENRLGIQMR